MSVTNWATCPQCIKQREYDKDRLTHRDFMDKWDGDEIKTTLREDYGIFVERVGGFVLVTVVSVRCVVSPIILST